MRMMQRVPSENRWLNLSAGFVATTLHVGCAPILEEIEAEADGGDGECSAYCDGACCVDVAEETEPSSPIVRPLDVPGAATGLAVTAGIEVIDAEAEIDSESQPGPRKKRSSRRRSRRAPTPAEVQISVEAGAATHGAYGSTREALEPEGDTRDAVEATRGGPRLSASDGSAEDPVVRSLQRAVDSTSGADAAWGASPIGAAYPR